MIKPEELRLGNIVTINNPKSWPTMKGVPLKVTGIRFCYDNTKSHPDSNSVISLSNGSMDWNQFNEYIETISITKEWLLKFGFEEKENAHYVNRVQYIKESYRILFDGIGTFVPGELVVLVKCRGNYVSANISTVLELQNIYFALTGEELKYEL